MKFRCLFGHDWKPLHRILRMADGVVWFCTIHVHLGHQCRRCKHKRYFPN